MKLEIGSSEPLVQYQNLLQYLVFSMSWSVGCKTAKKIAFSRKKVNHENILSTIKKWTFSRKMAEISNRYSLQSSALLKPFLMLLFL